MGFLFVSAASATEGLDPFGPDRGTAFESKSYFFDSANCSAT